MKISSPEIEETTICSLKIIKEVRPQMSSIGNKLTSVFVMLYDIISSEIKSVKKTLKHTIFSKTIVRTRLGCP